jgi:DNA-binding response OmpR family regulator
LRLGWAIRAPTIDRQGDVVAVSVIVLLVEDEPYIRDLVIAALEEGGFAVVGASNGEEAVALLEANSAEYHALVSDVKLGRGITGWDVARRARELSDQVAVVYMTGGNGHEWASKGVPRSVLVAKPFAAAQIVTAVSQLLNTHGA